MKFTVLMSVYKKEKPSFLQQCLDSLDQQSLQADEYLIICDGDLTPELDQIIENFQDKHPAQCRIHRFKQNRGLGQALADGVQLASHEWIGRMDTDDIARPDRFEKQISYIKKHPELSLVGSEILEFSEDIRHPFAKRSVPEDHEEILTYARRRNPFNHMTVFYRKQAVLQAGNYRDLSYYEDYYLWVRMLAQGVKCYNIQEPLVYARANEDLYKRRGGWAYFLNGFKAYNKIYKQGLAGPSDWMIRNVGQAIINLAPNTLRAKLYKRFLRK